MIAPLQKLAAGEGLSAEQAGALLIAMTEPHTDPVLVGAVLAALRTKGETELELRGFAQAMLARAVRPPIDAAHAVDIVGTGGDGSHSLNLSTGAALLTAACNVPVIKHGNRAVSGRSGSADVLEALGYELELSPTATAAEFHRTGFAFLFAPTYHPALGDLRTVRRSLGIRTIFNVLGPLVNPAQPPFAVLGAPTRETALLMARAVAGMHFRRVFVVHGTSGWDEPTSMGSFTVFDVCGHDVHVQERDPGHFGIRRCRSSDLAGGDSAYNAKQLRRVLEGAEHGPHRDSLVLGAALALEVSGCVKDFSEGLARASDAIDSEESARFLQTLIPIKEGVQDASR